MPAAAHAVRCLTPVLVVGLLSATPARAAPETGAERVAALSCAVLDPETYRDTWQPGQSPYGLPFEAWDRPAFEALKQRFIDCATPANQRRMLMVPRYIDMAADRTLRQAEAQRAATSRAAALADEIRTNLTAAATEPDLVQRRARLASLTTKLDTSRLPADVQAPLRIELSQQLSALTAAEEARRRAAQDAAARHEAEQRQQAQAAQDAAARQQVEQRRQAQAEAAATERHYAERLLHLSPDLVAFLSRNPSLKAPSTRADVLNALAYIDTMATTLDACREQLGAFRAEWTEVQRRLGILQRVLLVYHGVPAAELTQAAQDRHAKAQAAGLLTMLRTEPRSLRQACEGAVIVVSTIFDFSA